VLGPRDLALCSGTLGSAPLRQKIEAASAAGFRGISLWVEDVERANAEGFPPRDVRTLLEDRGLGVAEIDPLLSWLRTGTLGKHAAAGADARIARGADEFFAVADAIGGRVVNCAHPFPGPVDLDQAAEVFARLCDRAAEHGVDCAIEFLPWTGIPDVATAEQIVRRAGRRNGGIMLDTWHHFRGTNDDEALRRLDGALVRGVQINGAPAQPNGPAMVESMRERLLPDEGDIDVAGLVAILDEIGSRAPIGVEVFSDSFAALDPREIAARCASAAQRVLARARGSLDRAAHE